MGDDYLTHKGLARLVGVSETTIKSYRRKFPGALPVVSLGKPIRFAARAQDACRIIREGFCSGLSVEEVRRRLIRKLDWFSPGRKRRGAVRAEGAVSGDMPGDMSGATSGDMSGEIFGPLRSALERVADLEARLARLEAEADGNGRGTDANGEGAGGCESPRSFAPGGDSDDEAMVAGGGRVVRIRSRDGEYRRYRVSPLKPDGRGPLPGLAGGGRRPPEAEFLNLPLVVRSEGGEFLGIAGREGHLNISKLLDLMRRKAGEAGLDVSWLESGSGAWVLRMGLMENGQSVDYSIGLGRTVTPRGNHVALLTAMSVNGQDRASAELNGFLRVLRRDFDR